VNARRRVAAGLGAGALLALPVGAGAIPPGGPAENPGDPPATVTIATPSVPAAGGAVAFTGTGFLTAAGAPQKVYVKLDDHGDHGIGPFTADATGALHGRIALSDPEAPADIGDAAREHWLRFLTGPSGADPDNGPSRSLKAAFRVTAPAVRAVAAVLTARGGSVALALRAGGPDGSRGAVVVRASGWTVARGTYALGDGATHAVRVPLTAAGRRRTTRAAALTARLTLTPREGAAIRSTVTVKGAAR
jgi:hypothetical protein